MEYFLCDYLIFLFIFASSNTKNNFTNIKIKFKNSKYGRKKRRNYNLKGRA